MTYRRKNSVVSTTWAVVADRGEARILSIDDTGTVNELESLTNPEGTTHQSDAVSDRQGYFGGREGSLESGDPQTDFAHKTAETFAAQISDVLEAARNHQKFGRLVLIAAPMFLGVLRKKLPVPLTRMVAAEIDKDYVKCSVEEITSRISQLS